MDMSDRMEDIVDEFCDQEQFHSFEGDRGVERLNVIAKVLGYEESGFKYGTSLEQFLSDNPGAIEALVDWIKDESNGLQEWKFAFLQNLESGETTESENNQYGQGGQFDRY